MRGKVLYKNGKKVEVRITPAYAGKSFKVKEFACKDGDHPRVCGEKCFAHALSLPKRGSPPRMRGKVKPRMPTFSNAWITPAYAGKSTLQTEQAEEVQDHPRVCGEKKPMRGGKDKRMGSPPRMRGKGRVYSSINRSIGITPAYAGKRLKRSRSTVPHAAIVPLFPSVYNKPAGSDGSPAGHDAPPFLPIENAAPASPAYNLRSL